MLKNKEEAAEDWEEGGETVQTENRPTEDIARENWSSYLSGWLAANWSERSVFFVVETKHISNNKLCRWKLLRRVKSLTSHKHNKNTGKNPKMHASI